MTKITEITSLGIFELVGTVIIAICVFVILVSVLINFVEGRRNVKIKREKKSIVETGTMFLFFLFFYFIIRLNIGSFQLNNFLLRIFLVTIGLIVLIIGCYVNVSGRLSLGKNWANQIKVYEDHTLVKTGVYKLVRHPLYASLIWMFYSASFIYLNYLAFLANTLIFVPFMYYRAKQEEKLLLREFPEYNKYQKEVGMFFPRLNIF